MFTSNIYGGVSVENEVVNGGEQYVYDNGTTSNTVIKNGGIQYINQGGWAFVVNISSGGKQIVSGQAYVFNTTISNGATQIISSVGWTSGTHVLSGGALTVNGQINSSNLSYQGGRARSVIVESGGKMSIAQGAEVRNLTLSGGAKLSIDHGYISNLYGKKGAAVDIKSNSFSLSGTDNKLTGTKITIDEINYDRSVINLSLGSILELNGNNNLDSVVIKSGSINITAENNKVRSTTSCTINHHLDNLKSPNKKYMLIYDKSSNVNSNFYGSMSITVKKNQKVGTYKITKNVNWNESSRITIYMDKDVIGREVFGKSININGMLYKGIFNKKGKTADVSISLYGSKVYRGTVNKDNLKGTTNSDIFYGGKGNDTITGKNGRDVAVYDKTAWGKDVINKTNGTMTLLFKDLKASDIIQKTSGKNMIITRKGDSKQSITVQNWSDSTHNIVFGSGMTAFNKYLKATSPTKAQTTAARNEVWKKAGLASA